jgi:5'-nucleotidase
MRFLVSNDDGIYSPGLALLARVADRFGEVVAVAPDVENSSASHSISAGRPVSYRRTRIGGDVEAYRVNGTPADCVALGLFHHSDIDVVLSGVNLGTNLGNGIWHSGTMAAARQASLLGVRGIALSTPVVSDDPDLEGLDSHVARVLDLLLARDDLRLVNVNLPARPRGIYWARQAVEKYDGEVVPAEDPYGRPVYWLAVTQLREHKPDTDLWAFERGYITITPLRLDLTSHSALSTLAEDRVTEFEDEPEPQVISDEEAAKESDESIRSEAWKPGETTSTISKR